MGGFFDLEESGGLFRNGRYATRVDDYAAVIERKPNAAAYYYRGKAYRRLDENQLALDDFDKAIEISPRFAEAYLSRGEIYDRLD